MRLKNLQALPHPDGNRIDLSWEFDAPAGSPCRVRVVRRGDTYPTSEDDGIVVSEGSGVYSASDTGLQAETVYYYTLFTSIGELSGPYDLDPLNRVAAMATGCYDMAGQLYGLLPAIYRRYDARPPDSLQPLGPLRRFLDLPGGQLDQIFSFGRALLHLYDLDRVDARLLPLLAGWIGGRLDYRQEIARQRNELRYAASIQEAIGNIPTLEAGVKRLTGWECRAKEFANNVFRSNEPERLNLWARRQVDGGWSVPSELLSIDFAYEGRPALVRRDEPDGRTRLWLFYQSWHSGDSSAACPQPGPTTAARHGTWEIRYKTALSFRVEAAEFKRLLEERKVSPALQARFAEQGLSLSLDLTIDEQSEGTSRIWLATDRQLNSRYTLQEDGNDLVVSAGWSPSQPLARRSGLDTHPTAVIWNGDVWVFWESYDEEQGRWRIDYCVFGAQGWSAIATFDPGGNLGRPGQDAASERHASGETERRMPCAVTDSEGRLWLFWFTRSGGDWQFGYNSYSAGDGVPGFSAGFYSPQSLTSGTPPYLFDPPFALVRNGDLWLFWAPRAHPQPTPARRGGDRRIAWSVMQTSNPTTWDAVNVQTETPADAEDCEPAALVNQAGKIELFWSSNRDGSWSIWRSEWDDARRSWGTAQELTGPPYSERAPFPIADSPGTLLVYRSSESLAYTSPVYAVTRTLDTRYAGCTTVDTRNRARLASRALFADFETYTWDTGPYAGRTNANWYAPDTVGLYLTPDTDDPGLIARNRNLIEYISHEYLPIQVRPVFIIEPRVSQERVYAPPRTIGETYFDSLLPEAFRGPDEKDHWDTVPGWIWVHTWSQDFPDHRTVDVLHPPVDTKWRTWHVGIRLSSNMLGG